MPKRRPKFSFLFSEPEKREKEEGSFFSSLFSLLCCALLSFFYRPVEERCCPFQGNKSGGSSSMYVFFSFFSVFFCRSFSLSLFRRSFLDASLLLVVSEEFSSLTLFLDILKFSFYPMEDVCRMNPCFPFFFQKQKNKSTTSTKYKTSLNEVGGRVLFSTTADQSNAAECGRKQWRPLISVAAGKKKRKKNKQTERYFLFIFVFHFL